MNKINPNAGQSSVAFSAMPNASEIDHEHEVKQSAKTSIAPCLVLSQEQQVHLAELKSRAASKCHLIKKQKELVMEILECLNINPLLLGKFNRLTTQPEVIKEIVQTFTSDSGSDLENLRENLLKILNQGEKFHNTPKRNIQNKSEQFTLKWDILRILRSKEIDYSSLKSELKKVLVFYSIDPQFLEKISPEKQEIVFRKISELFVNYRPIQRLEDISSLVLQKQIIDTLNDGLDEENSGKPLHQAQIPEIILNKSRELVSSSNKWKSNASNLVLSKQFVSEMLKYFEVDHDSIKDFQLLSNRKFYLEILEVIARFDPISTGQESMQNQILEIIEKACAQYNEKNIRNTDLNENDLKTEYQTQQKRANVELEIGLEHETERLSPAQSQTDIVFMSTGLLRAIGDVIRTISQNIR